MKQIEVYIGDTVDIPFVIMDQSGDPVNLTGWTRISLGIKESPGEAALVSISEANGSTSQVTITGLTTGALTVRLTSAQTAALTPNDLQMQLQYEIGGKKITLPVVIIRAKNSVV